MIPFQLSRTGSSDNLHSMNDSHHTARSSDLVRHLYCLLVGFLTTQAFFPPPNKVAKRLSVSQTSCLQASRMRALHYRNSLSYRRAPEFGAQAQYHTVSKPKPVSHSLRRGLFDLSQRVDKHRGDA